VKTLIVGIGSTILGDDGVGVHIARRLMADSLPKNVDVVELGTAGLTLLEYLEGYDRLVLLDAILSGAPPGTIHELTSEEVARTVHLGAGHEADLPTALAMGHKLMKDSMPKQITVFAIEAADTTSFSEQLTPEVQASIPDVLRSVNRLLSR